MQVTLLDDKNQYLDSAFKRDVPNIAVGECIELEGFLVDIEQEATKNDATNIAAAPAPPAPKPAARPVSLLKRMRVDRLPSTGDASSNASLVDATPMQDQVAAPLPLGTKRSCA